LQGQDPQVPFLRDSSPLPVLARRRGTGSPRRGRNGEEVDAVGPADTVDRSENSSMAALSGARIRSVTALMRPMIKACSFVPPV